MKKTVLLGLVTSSAVALAFACGGSDVDIPASPDSGAPGSSSGASSSGASSSGASSSGASSSSSSGGASSSSSSSSGGDGGAKLPAGAACAKDDECQSGGCDYGGHCAVGRSCTRHEGGDTCGPTANESCCVALAVPKPGAAFKLDKYSITAGRYRAFVEKTGGNLRGYVQANRPSWWEPAWDDWVPSKMDDGTVNTTNNHVYAAGTGRDGVYQALGPIHYGTEGPGNEGCLTKQVGNARTYRIDDATNTALFADTQQYSQAVLDQKPIQCLTFMMVAAFCAWDGGRMPTLAELDYAWDAGDAAGHLYPWGNSPAPGGWNDAYPSDPTGKGFGTPAPPGSDMTYANYKYNFWMPATMKCIGDDPAKCDYSLYLAPPGRFPKGNGPFGHADLAGDVYNWAGPMSGPAGGDPAGRTVGLARTGAFDNHAIPNQHPVPGFRNAAATNKYLAIGGRCAR